MPGSVITESFRGRWHCVSVGEINPRRCVVPEVEIGVVSDYFARPMAAGVHLAGILLVGDKVHIKGHTTDVELVVSSMQVNNSDVKEGKAGDDVGIKVPERVRRGDVVYKVA